MPWRICRLLRNSGWLSSGTGEDPFCFGNKIGRKMRKNGRISQFLSDGVVTYRWVGEGLQLEPQLTSTKWTPFCNFTTRAVGWWLCLFNSSAFATGVWSSVECVHRAELKRRLAVVVPLVRLLYGWALMWVTYWPSKRLANLIPRVWRRRRRQQQRWLEQHHTDGPVHTRIFHRSWPSDSPRAGSSTHANPHPRHDTQRAAEKKKKYDVND